MRKALLLLVQALAAGASAATPVTLVTGATGRTGSLLYLSLKQKGQDVRAFVRSADKAREVLNCSACDESEGIYVGNVTDPAALVHAAEGISTVAICVGAGPSSSPEEIKAVEFQGVQNTVAALAQPSNVAAVGLSGLRIALVSSMGTTNPTPDQSEGGQLLLFYKLLAEAFIGASGVPFSIVKPCGLLDTAGGSSTLLIGHDDTLLSTKPPLISRTDVAMVVESTLSYDGAPALRLDLCSTRGPPPSDLSALLDTARYPWQV